MVGNGDDSLSFLGLKAYFQGRFAWFQEGLSSNRENPNQIKIHGKFTAPHASCKQKTLKKTKQTKVGVGTGQCTTSNFWFLSIIPK